LSFQVSDRGSQRSPEVHSVPNYKASSIHWSHHSRSVPAPCWVQIHHAVGWSLVWLRLIPTLGQALGFSLGPINIYTPVTPPPALLLSCCRDSLLKRERKGYKRRFALNFEVLSPNILSILSPISFSDDLMF
jgi:hypothetical protein